MKKKRVNPHRKPASQADVNRAKNEATNEAIKRICYLMLYILIEKHNAPYLDARKRLLDNGFVCAGLVHYGTAVPVNTAVEMLGDGFHGAVGQPEGVVYRYENAKQSWLFNAKFVSNPLVGDAELFRKNIDSGLMNKWR